ncbi:MAG: hypothetical protein A2Y63_05025 [Candidatus Riflebacteria bacterium RBG_13_59_9]|nr:MAG: hypothetical protein A2Y63_05025 [Candidatus Riflebacteria bacterium RBG_13_59_9]
MIIKGTMNMATKTRKRVRKKPAAESKPHTEIGRLVRDLRISAGMTQFDLAEAIGVNNSYLSRIENGERRPSTKIMRKMAEALNCSYDELVVASGLLSPEFREKRVLGSGDASVLQDIHDIKTALNRLVPGEFRTSTVPFKDRLKRRAIPVFDRVPAGFFDEANVVEAYDDIQKLVLTEEELAYDPRAFALIVKGDSMTEAGILDGDMLIVSPNTSVVDGDIAVVQAGGRETTVKIVYFENEGLLLQPANSSYKPTLLKYPQEVEILGKVILVRRRLIV